MSGMVAQKGPGWVHFIPFPGFRLLCPPLLSDMLPGGAPTRVTPSPAEKKRDQLRPCTAEDEVKWVR